MILLKIVRALERLEDGQRVILERLERDGDRKAPGDEWLQDGIDNILNYQVGKKREDGQ